MKRTLSNSPLVFALLLGALAAAPAGGSAKGTETAPPSARAKPFRVILMDQAPYFDPKRLRIPVGSTVVWENRGPALVHTIYMATADGEVHSGSIHPGESFRHTFAAERDAVIRAACEVHPYMYGTVLVGDPPDSLVAAVENPPPEPVGTLDSVRFVEFPLPVRDSVPDIVAVDREDNVWFTMGGGGVKNIDLPSLDKVGRLTLDGDFRAFTLPTEASVPQGVVAGPDGAIYVTQFLGNKIARLDPRGKVLEEFEIPTPGARPTGLALDDRGNLWFSETGTDKLGRLSPRGVIDEFAIPTEGGHPTGLVIDAQGNVWFSERDTSKIGCLRTDGTFVEYTLPTPEAKPAGLAFDRHGRLWFAERRGNKIGVLEEGRIREYPLPHPHSGPFFPVVDDDGAVWFTEVYGDRIGRLDPETGEIVEYQLPVEGAWPGGLALDSQGNLWFALQLRNSIGVLLRSPEAVPTPHIMTAAGPGAPAAIAPAPDGTE